MIVQRALVLVLGGLAVSACAREAQPETLPAGAPIVVVVVDTLRADALGLYGSAHATSESLDRWAERGAVFERAFATSPWTLPSFVSLFTGRFPASHGSGRRALAPDDARTEAEFVGLDGSMPRLSTSLSGAGYATAAFVTNSFLRPGFGLAQGFDRYDFFRSKDRDERRADVMVDHALEWIDAQAPGQPWFCLLHVFDPHMPYDPPPAAAGRFTAGYRGALTAPIEVKSNLIQRVNSGELRLDEADAAFLRGLYDEEVSFTAAQLARLLDALAARGVLERGLVVVTADHGEEFLEHGRLEHGHTMHQELLHIPLLVFGRGVRAARHAEPVSLADVLPTLLEATGLARIGGLDGSSLWALLTGSGALAPRRLFAENSLYGDQESAIYEWPYKLIAGHDPSRRRLYDLERDPAEREDLAGARPEVVERLAAVLARRERGPERAAVALDPEVQDELRAIGYLGGPEDEEASAPQGGEKR